MMRVIAGERFSVDAPALLAGSLSYVFFLSSPHYFLSPLADIAISFDIFTPSFVIDFFADASPLPVASRQFRFAEAIFSFDFISFRRRCAIFTPAFAISFSFT
jgi:hypothetical protein